MVAKLSEFAQYCQQQAVATGDSVAGAVRETIAKMSYHPANPATDPYYSNITQAKWWDTIMTDFWNQIPAVSGGIRKPALLCYDATDLLIMTCAVLGVRARSVRAIAVNPASMVGGYPMYLDHTFAEVWANGKWWAQDAFFNCEYILDQYTPASVDDLCGAISLDDITPRNKATSGWANIPGLQAIKDEDFFAAFEHRDIGGGALNPVVNGSSTSYAGASSMVVLNEKRGNLDQVVRQTASSTPTVLRTLILGSTRYGAPTSVSFKG